MPGIAPESTSKLNMSQYETALFKHGYFARLHVQKYRVFKNDTQHGSFNNDHGNSRLCRYSLQWAVRGGCAKPINGRIINKSKQIYRVLSEEMSILYTVMCRRYWLAKVNWHGSGFIVSGLRESPYFQHIRPMVAGEGERNGTLFQICVDNTNQHRCRHGILSSCYEVHIRSTCHGT